MATRKPPSRPSPSPSTPAAPPSPPPVPHWDSVYHRLFAHASMVADLLGNYLPPELCATLDLARFAREAPLPLNAVQHSDKGHARTGDLLQPLFTTPETGARGALLLVEFQASRDATMSLRMMVYAGLGLQQLLARARRRPKSVAAAQLLLRATPTALPPVLPVVLYHGEEPWGGCHSARDNVRVAPTSPLAALQPDARYILIDAWRDEPHTPHRGPCVLLFALLRSPDTPALRAVAEELDALLLRIEPSATVDPDADPADLLAQDGSLRGAFLLFTLGLLRSRYYAAPYDVIPSRRPVGGRSAGGLVRGSTQEPLHRGLQQV